LVEAEVFNKEIVTEISKLLDYYPAENYHQNYYSQNQNQPYCSFVITPKLKKFREVFKEKIKKN